MVRIRLQRHGRKKSPYYHIVATDIRKKRDGGILEDLGRYNPVASPKKVTINTDRVVYWLTNGAQPSDTVRGLLKAEGIYFRLHLQRWGKSAEEIDQAISDWKSGKTVVAKTTRKDKLRSVLKAEEEQVSKDLAKKAADDAAAAKKAEEEKAAAEEAAKVEETATEEVAEATPAAEEAVAETPAQEEAQAESSDEQNA